MSESRSLRGTMKGHNDWVTAIATTPNPETGNMLVSASATRFRFRAQREQLEKFLRAFT